jgi:hypothetical protein
MLDIFSNPKKPVVSNQASIQLLHVHQICPVTVLNYNICVGLMVFIQDISFLSLILAIFPVVSLLFLTQMSITIKLYAAQPGISEFPQNVWI